MNSNFLFPHFSHFCILENYFILLNYFQFIDKFMIFRRITSIFNQNEFQNDTNLGLKFFWFFVFILFFMKQAVITKFDISFKIELNEIFFAKKKTCPWWVIFRGKILYNWFCTLYLRDIHLTPKSATEIYSAH